MPASTGRCTAGCATDSPITDGERLDRYLVRLGWAASRRSASTLIEDGRVRVNGRRQRKGATIGANDQVEITAPIASAEIPATKSDEPARKSRVEILYESAELLIVNKPPLLPCHPLHAASEASVITNLGRDYPEVAALGAKPFEGGLIHRLDNGTSGALMVARTSDALRFMGEALHAGRIYRRYEALIMGRLEQPIELTWPIAHHRKNPARMVIVDDSPLSTTASRAEKIVRAPYRGTPREAFTIVEPIAQAGAFTVVNVYPRSGRRHQIRIHLAGSGRAIANDELYGGPSLPPLAEGRFWLHLAELRFDSSNGKKIRVIAPRPQDLGEALVNAKIQQEAVSAEGKVHQTPGQGLPPRSRITTSLSGLRRTPPNLSRG
ncbi:MAG TPA: RluA family pseudouridine synthase [Candidatus Binataceae bacterium]|nr:RluA family pseudouridine synthase [Candidatus Binataceae bacterium]